jgi:hypothetical protein
LTDKSNHITQSYEENLAATARNLEDVLKTVGTKLEAEDKLEIQEIVDAAANLALDCSLQKARLYVFAIDEKEAVQTLKKTDVEDSNKRNETADNQDKDALEGVVELSISPGLKCLGDGRGASLNEPPQVISPARVFLSS